MYRSSNSALFLQLHSRNVHTHIPTDESSFPLKWVNFTHSSLLFLVVFRNFVKHLPYKIEYYRFFKPKSAGSYFEGIKFRDMRTCHKIFPIFTTPDFKNAYPSKFFSALQSYCSRTIADRLYYDWIAEFFGGVLGLSLIHI